MTKEIIAEEIKVRLDKWLWAARFYKTRSLAKDAVDGGKVHFNQQRCKPSKIVEVGAEIYLRIGFVEKTIVIKGIHGQRRNAVLAQALYEETEESISKREKALLERKHMMGDQKFPAGKPNKKDRRLIHQFKNINSD
jgi:ribosome-associated heat shock protein Hsp15